VSSRQYPILGFIGFLRDLDAVVRDVSGRSTVVHVTAWWEEHGRPFLEQLEKGHPTDPLEEEYAVLGLIPTASDEVVRAAFHAAIKKYHPDVEGGDEEMAKKVNLAYEKICQGRGMV